MIIGIPKERLDGERRVAITPQSCQKLVDVGHKVLFESGAGLGINISDNEYLNAGACITSQLEVWKAEFILKVKEPVKSEYQYFQEGQTICGFLHLAANRLCVNEMVEKKITAIACENIVIDNQFKLLRPVSEIAGRKALFTAIGLLEVESGGSGILLSGTSVASPGTVTIIGAGVVGKNALEMGLAIGAKVNILDLNEELLATIKQKYDHRNLNCFVSTKEKLLELASETNVLISTVLVPGGTPPKVITKQLLSKLQAGTVIVDVSSDQGGSVEGLTERTTHSKPTLDLDGVIYYGVPNMPAAVPKTATESIQGIVDLIIARETSAEVKLQVETGIQINSGQIVNQHLK